MRFQLLYETDSPLHRVNPLTKLVFTVAVMVVLTLIVDPITPLMCTALLLAAIVLVGKVPLGYILRRLRLFLIVALGLFWTTAFFYAADPGLPNHTLLHLGPLTLTDQGAAYGASITFRILAIFSASLLFTFTTDPSALLRALIQHWRVSQRFGYGIMAAYRFIPLFDGELASIRAARRVRGVADGGGPAAAYQSFVGCMVPLLAGGVRHAERVAIAMDARGFGAHPYRTFYRRVDFSRADVLFALIASLVFAGLLVGLHLAGWLGQQIPPFLT